MTIKQWVTGIIAKIKSWFKKEKQPVKNEPVKLQLEKSPPLKESNQGTIPTKKYPGIRAYHKGCFGLSPAEKRYREA